MKLVISFFKRIFPILSVIILLGGVNVQAAVVPKSIEKKITKSIAKVWSNEEITREKIEMDAELGSKYSGIRNVSLYRLKGGEEVKGYLCFSSSKGRFDYFDYMVIFNADLEIQHIEVLVYRSSYGGEVAAQSWLKQFYGKKEGRDMEFGKDIDTISGATLSAPSLTQGVKSISHMLVDLKSQGKL